MRDFRQVLSLCMGLVMAVCVAATSAQETLPSFEVIKAGYTQSISAIETLKVRFEIQGQHQTTGLTYFDVVYHNDTNRHSTLVRMGRGPETITNRVWLAFDGTYYSHWTENFQPDPEGPYYSPVGKIGPDKVGNFSLPCSLRTGLGTRFWGEKHQISELFTPDNGPEITSDKVGDVSCVKVSFKDHAGLMTTAERPIKYQTQIWFDPAVDYLPRRIRSEYNYKDEKSFADCVNIEFELVQDSKLNRQIRFPKLVNYKRPGTEWQMKLTELEINKPLAAEVFTPKFPDGMKVVDRRQPGAAKHVLIGPPELRKSLEERSQAAAVKHLTKPQHESITPPQFAAEPVKKTSIALVVGSILAISAIAFFLIRWRRAQ